jgi:hypothetical protein
MRSATALLGAATATATALLVMAPANAGDPTGPEAEVLAEGLDGPLQVDATDGGVYFSQSNLSGLKSTKLTKLRNNGSTVDLVTMQGPRVEIAGVAERNGHVAYTFSRFNQQDPVAELRVRKRNGNIERVGDLQRFEERNNPDAGQTYGLQDLEPSCEVPPFLQSYQGIVESHPYAIANAGRNGWFVADAAGNSIVKVGKNGGVREVAVLPPQPAVVTEEAAEANDLPPCTVGKTFIFEPVPTDVQKRGGSLYVTLLPGGPEDPSLGARGQVVKIDPQSGDVEEVASGFLSATNVALAPRKMAYVTELFGGQVSLVDLTSGDSFSFAERPLPSAADLHDGTLYLTENIFGAPGTASGQLVAIDTRMVR